ncbi:cytochrome c oxidase subunit 3 [Sphingomonas nostoxanthinifaciens]|uniref:cytochrome c oxidase subunit 3 n=1 Tax=Sphingomonas nostoxanthinifaciens TaxID=2872652 RepID=UPI001CC1FB9D|nr:cytochrome c oxidase subunit 3 [Sphingomonas nostoxanthinifaciens]UAK24742.1 cytochrome c oxidase subunit 3 [Sphingomonas nostoxanthinifaciens]
MAGAKSHDYHILPPSPWPLLGAIAGFMFAIGAIMYMHSAPYGGFMWAFGVLCILGVMAGWWGQVIKEAHAGDHTPVVSLHLRYGMILFIASEVMFFVGWFWAWFDFSLFPSTVDAVGGVWPPKGIEVINPFAFPLLNTLILLCSGTTVTWAHHALLHGDRKGMIQGLWCTILLGLTFSFIQAWEYAHAPFAFKGLNYGAAFFMATGFHGFHVLVGTIFLSVNLVRAYKGEFTPKQHFGFEAAAWYWHFVDVVWLFLFVSIYVWGGWGAPIHAG